MSRLKRYYALYFAGVVLFVGLLALAERAGVGQRWLGYAFVFATFALYAGIGVMSRAAKVSEQYMARAQVPAMVNGMAAASDWMSAASFVGLAGTLFINGYQGLAFVMGWTGGYCLVAMLLAPYLHKFKQLSIPDFFSVRYGGNAMRLIAVGATILASFAFVVAQVYCIGLITSRFTGIEFRVGVFVGMAGILACSFIGGMRVVTWTQVAQYVTLIVAYLIPVAVISWQVTHNPVPQVSNGRVLEKLAERESTLILDKGEISARQGYLRRANEYGQKINELPASLDSERVRLEKRVHDLKMANASARTIAAAERDVKNLPKDELQGRSQWGDAQAENLARSRPASGYAQAFPERDEQDENISRRNFLALAICLMVGTAAFPHALTRYYTTANVRRARHTAFWSLLFISLLYVSAVAYAALARLEILDHLVGSSFSSLPTWVNTWSHSGNARLEDINHDGVVQWAEVALNPDIIVLVIPEVVGLPYVITGLLAAGGLAAAWSTANILLLTISNALSQDIYTRMLAPRASTQSRLMISKSFLLLVAFLAAWVASLRPDNILGMVGLAFSIAAATFFPALVCGIFWKRANRQGAVAGMMAGLAITLYYIVSTHGFFGGSMQNAWGGIEPIAAGIFGLPAGFLALIITSLATKSPPQAVMDLVETARRPVI